MSDLNAATAQQAEVVAQKDLVIGNLDRMSSRTLRKRLDSRSVLDRKKKSSRCQQIFNNLVQSREWVDTYDLVFASFKKDFERATLDKEYHQTMTVAPTVRKEPQEMITRPCGSDFYAIGREGALRGRKEEGSEILWGSPPGKEDEPPLQREREDDALAGRDRSLQERLR